MQLDKIEFEEFRPIDFLTFSCELNSRILELNSCRSSIKRTIFSRCYYATFLSLREILSQNTEYISNPYGEHRRLANFIEYNGPFDRVLNEKLARRLRILKKLRIQSDYYLEVPPKGTKEYENWVFEDTDFAIDLSNRIINKFKNRFKNS